MIGVIPAGADDLGPVNGRGQQPLNGDGFLARQVQGLRRLKRSGSANSAPKSGHGVITTEPSGRTAPMPVPPAA